MANGKIQIVLQLPRRGGLFAIWHLKSFRPSSVLSQKLVREVSPSADGRNNVAHGVSRGSSGPPSPPSPLPPARERGAEGGVRAHSPRACALGYSISPLPGLRKALRHQEDLLNELLIQDTSS